MELRQLATFVTVAEELSFTRAARRLNVVQSGVSASVQALERELGAQLFNRSSQRVALTEAGAVLLPAARRTLAEAAAARAAVDELSGRLGGTLAVGTMQSAAPIDLAAILGRFHARHPHVTVRLRHGPAGSAVLAQELLDEQLDLAFISLPGRPPAGLALRPLATETMVVVCPPGHALARQATVSLARLGQETFVDFPPGYGNRMVVDRAFAAAGVERSVPFEVADFAAAADLVRHGLGIAFLPAFAATPLDDLHILRVRARAPRWELSAATLAARPASAALRALLADVEASARERRG